MGEMFGLVFMNILLIMLPVVIVMAIVLGIEEITTRASSRKAVRRKAARRRAEEAALARLMDEQIALKMEAMDACRAMMREALRWQETNTDNQTRSRK